MIAKPDLTCMSSWLHTCNSSLAEDIELKFCPSLQKYRPTLPEKMIDIQSTTSFYRLVSYSQLFFWTPGIFLKKAFHEKQFPLCMLLWVSVQYLIEIDVSACRPYYFPCQKGHYFILGLTAFDWVDRCVTFESARGTEPVLHQKMSLENILFLQVTVILYMGFLSSNCAKNGKFCKNKSFNPINLFLQDMLLCGLHTCGDLSSTMLRLFSSNPSIGIVCNVPCCYHLLTEEFDQQGEDNNEEHYGFPMSSCLKSQKTHIGSVARMAACMVSNQSPRWGGGVSHSHYFQYLVCVLLMTGNNIVVACFEIFEN